MTLSEKLKQLRVKKGLTQEKLAELTGVSRQAVAKWENGQSRPTYENLAALESIYGLEPYRLSGENPPKKENKILQANLIKIAIIAQAACLNVAIQPLDEGFTGGMYIFALVVKYLPLFLASIWMSANMRYEKSRATQKKLHYRTDILSYPAGCGTLGLLQRPPVCHRLPAYSNMLYLCGVYKPQVHEQAAG